MCGHRKTRHRGRAGRVVFLRFRDQFVHPYLKVRFRNYDLASLDHGTKMILLDDMNQVRGVKALKRRDT